MNINIDVKAIEYLKKHNSTAVTIDVIGCSS